MFMSRSKGYVKAAIKKEGKKKEEKRKIKYTYNEAVNVVLDLANVRAGIFPLEDDYIKAEEDGVIDIDGLIKALNIEYSMKQNGVKAYAAINIEVLRALREREGKSAYAVGVNNGYSFYGEDIEERERRKEMIRKREEAKAARR